MLSAALLLQIGLFLRRQRPKLLSLRLKPPTKLYIGTHELTCLFHVVLTYRRKAMLLLSKICKENDIACKRYGTEEAKKKLKI